MRQLGTRGQVKVKVKLVIYWEMLLIHVCCGYMKQKIGALIVMLSLRLISGFRSDLSFQVRQYSYTDATEC